MGLYIAGLLTLSYVCFVFFAEELNPFKNLENYPFRRRLLYGRKMAFAVLASGFVVFFLYGVMNFYLSVAATAGLGEFLVLWVVFHYQYKKLVV